MIVSIWGFYRVCSVVFGMDDLQYFVQCVEVGILSSIFWGKVMGGLYDSVLCGREWVSRLGDMGEMYDSFPKTGFPFCVVGSGHLGWYDMGNC